MPATSVPRSSVSFASSRIRSSVPTSSSLPSSCASLATFWPASCAAIARPTTSPSFDSRFVSSAIVFNPSSSRRRARAGRRAPSGGPRSRISACVCSIGYGTRRKVPRPASSSINSQAARASPSRGCPTEPGLRSQRRPASSALGARRGEAARRASRRPSASASATWLWPTSTSGAVVSRSSTQRDLLAEHVLPDRVARAAVEELGSGRVAGGLQRAQPVAPRRHRARPASSARPPPRRR